MKKLVPIKIGVVKGDPSKGEPSMKHPAGHNPHLIDTEGIGMHYSRVNRLDTGVEIQWAVTAVPREYFTKYKKAAEEAGHGELVVELTESEAEAFFEAEIPEDEEIVDLVRLQAIKLKKDLGLPLTTQDEAALDPATEERGLVKNKLKGFKGKLKAIGAKAAK